MSAAGKVMITPGAFNAFKVVIAIVINSVVGRHYIVLQCDQSKHRFDGRARWVLAANGAVKEWSVFGVEQAIVVLLADAGNK